MDITVHDNPGQNRYDALDGETVAGFAAYEIVGGLIAFTHTKVHDDYEGRGVGSALAAGALDDARGRGLTVRPLCSFIDGYIARHQEYADLLGA